MSRKAKDLRAQVSTWLRENRVPEPYTFGHTGAGHQECRFTVAGKPRRFIFPSSPSDHRGVLNMRTALKRLTQA